MILRILSRLPQTFSSTLRPVVARMEVEFPQTFQTLRRNQRRIFSALALVPMFGAMAAFGVAPLAPDADLLPTQIISENLPIPELDQQIEQLREQEQHYLFEERIRRGDTLGTILNRLGVADIGAEQFIRSDATARALYQLRAGRVIQAQTDSVGQLVRLRYVHTPIAEESIPGQAQSTQSRAVEIVRQGVSFQAEEITLDIDRRVEMRSGEIRHSLFGATDAAGVPDVIAIQIAEIFSGDIDFHRDLRQGDQFRVVFELYYQGGESIRSGRVLAVEFINNGRTHQAVWYAAPDGQAGSYYSFNGESLRRAFLRSPIEFSRVSSGFGSRRHPIFNTWRSHNGVDYAAPTGTPIRTTGDGTIQFLGRQGGYGNVIIVRHSGQYSTLYAHLSGFAKGLRTGMRVSQSQLIGYVGMTGWATGPHLHYEFRIANAPQDPLKVVLPQSPSLTRSQLPLFQESTLAYHRRIDLLRSIQNADQVARTTAPATGGGV